MEMKSVPAAKLRSRKSAGLHKGLVRVKVWTRNR